MYKEQIQGEQIMRQKEQVIYYNENGQVDKFATYINNNDWCLPVMFILSVLVIGFVEGI